MTTVWWLVQSGWIAVIAIGLLLAETAFLCLVAKSPKHRLKMLAGGAAAGMCLMAALGCALRGYPILWVALFLTLSLVAHVFDVAARLRA